jgi:hypothetical protein
MFEFGNQPISLVRVRMRVGCFGIRKEVCHRSLESNGNSNQHLQTELWPVELIPAYSRRTRIPEKVDVGGVWSERRG